MSSPIRPLLDRLEVPATPAAVAIGRDWQPGRGATVEVRSPIDGSPLASFPGATDEDLPAWWQAAVEAFSTWRSVPAPRRGELVRRIGEQFRRHKSDLAALVSWEVGKITQEALGEVQEMIDMCDFAVGLSRQLYGLTIASERPRHRLAEQWHPAGTGRRDHGLQFPGRRLGLERDARPGLRRCRGLEAVGEDAAVRHGLPGDCRPACWRTCRRRRAGVLGLVVGRGPGRRAGPGCLAKRCR